jgi:DNA adenine methylase
MPFYTPLRYPGGKGKLANFIKLVFKQNNLNGVEYAEPYGGGAAIALSLLFEGYVDHIHINDLSKPIYSFWYSALYQTDELCALINETKISVQEWGRQRDILRNANQVSLLELGFSTFFLNRTNRSGIITGGVIGGKKQNGKYKINARFTKNTLISRIRRIASFQHQISIYNKDAVEFIKNDVCRLSKKSLVFLDPPYFVKGRDLYENFYKLENHKDIARIVSRMNQNWIVTYDNVPEILKLYSKYRHIKYKLSYSATDRYHGSEVMFLCNRLAIPKVKTSLPLSNERIVVP